ETYLESQPDPAAARAALNRLHPVGRVGRPTDVGDLAVYLASDRSGFLTGEIVVLDGGWTAKLPLPFRPPCPARGSVVSHHLVDIAHHAVDTVRRIRTSSVPSRETLHDHPARAGRPPRQPPGRPRRSRRPPRGRVQPGSALLQQPGGLRPRHGRHLDQALA